MNRSLFGLLPQLNQPAQPQMQPQQPQQFRSLLGMGTPMPVAQPQQPAAPNWLMQLLTRR
ncbi:hypothetical protein J2X35_001118 [Mesorhizobium sp. BE184]|nr:hypothetical protein [Mesorhizobium sp. BE184]